MPFKSEAQRRWMFKAAERGEIAKGVLAKFRRHTGNKVLPEKVTPLKKLTTHLTKRAG